MDNHKYITNQINPKNNEKPKTKTYKVKDVFKGTNIRNKNKIIAKVKTKNNKY